ncbi:CynX/NimT family MFS transporter [Ornithinibacillus halophilus]|uniref:MFS transporter, CP family, cyanate transporter n=1 Tax=Ornithinibacillus halophilus TaxID=930117 RepID=A0A1M5FEX8_9BACI|nr:MFS transporter [Ornithinibacillus halophilus]SHF90117.1 MFS transporter, CP family, cyanate transporter [Ornithinibacillus halophilus]
MVDLQQSKANSSQWYRAVLVVGIIFIAFNLRPAITSVGPLIGTIRDDIGLSNWSAGLLTSLPLIAFAFMSPIVARIGNRYTNERALLWGLIVLLVGISIRSISVLFFLFVGTLLVGVGIAICNVLLPGVIKEKFPAKVGLMTSIYSTAMGIFAAVASGVSVPLASGMDLGWQLALLVWSIPSVIGIGIWFYLSRKKQSESDVEGQYVPSENRMWKSPLAWQVAAYMGLQSFLFYVTISWLPEILHNNGVTMETAGWMLSFTQFIGLPASFLVPVIAGRLQSQRSIVLVIGVFSITGYSGLLLGSSFVLMIVSTTLIGLALSGSFALALAFLGMRARDSKQAAELSGMAQALGYVFAAIGPIFIGYLYDVTHVWTIPLITLIVVSLLVALFGMAAGRNKYVL